MLNMLKAWYNQRFSDPQAIGLAIILFSCFIAIYFFSSLLAPILIAIVLAYLLEWPINILNHRLKLPRLLSVCVVLGGFITLVIFMILILLPALWYQTSNLLSDLPTMINQLNSWLLSLPESYPEYIDYATIDNILNVPSVKFISFGESLLRYSFSSLLSIVTIGIYTFLVPFMTFFLVKDKHILIKSFTQLLPRNRNLAVNVWVEMKQQIANYIKGKLFEIIIIAIVSYLIFIFFDLRYPLLLAVAVGLSVLVPYIGAVLVTIPVAIVAAFQFGMTPTFWYLMIAYVISQLLDGNVLVPLLFSEAVNLHPLTIIISVIIFGGLWGFWGVFFAIPLATLVKAVMNAWPTIE